MKPSDLDDVFVLISTLSIFIVFLIAAVLAINYLDDDTELVVPINLTVDIEPSLSEPEDEFAEFRHIDLSGLPDKKLVNPYAAEMKRRGLLKTEEN